MRVPSRKKKTPLRTLCKFLVQVELESSAAEAKHLASLCEEAVVCQAILTHWVEQQQCPHIPTLAFYRTGRGGKESVREQPANQSAPSPTRVVYSSKVHAYGSLHSATPKPRTVYLHVQVKVAITLKCP